MPTLGNSGPLIRGFGFAPITVRFVASANHEAPLTIPSIMGEASEFARWGEQNLLSDETLATLSANGFDSLLAISRMEEEDLKALKISPRGQACLLKGAAKELKASSRSQHVQGPTAPLLEDMRLQNPITHGDCSLDDLIQRTIRGSHESEQSTTVLAQSTPPLPADNIDARAGESHKSVSAFITNSLSHVDVHPSAISVGGNKISIEQQPTKTRFDKLSPHQWAIGNARILCELMRTNDLSMEGVRQYLAYTIQISELAERFEWRSVLKYDHDYRLKIAATKLPWGTDFPFLAALHLRDKIDDDNDRAYVRKNKRATKEPCRLFSRGHCPYGNKCIFIHSSALPTQSNPEAKLEQNAASTKNWGSRAASQQP